MARSFTLPQFDQISIASPCSMRWDDMEGDDRTRFCGSCRLNVYNISEMTRHEAEALILAKEGRLCIRMFRRTDGTILTRNCPVGLRRVRHTVVRAVGSVAAVLALAVGSLAAAGERLRGRSVKISQTQPYRSLVEMLRTPPAPPAPPPWNGPMIMGAMAITPIPPTTMKTLIDGATDQPKSQDN